MSTMNERSTVRDNNRKLWRELQAATRETQHYLDMVEVMQTIHEHYGVFLEINDAEKVWDEYYNKVSEEDRLIKGYLNEDNVKTAFEEYVAKRMTVKPVASL